MADCGNCRRNNQTFRDIQKEVAHIGMLLYSVHIPRFKLSLLLKMLFKYYMFSMILIIDILFTYFVKFLSLQT